MINSSRVINSSGVIISARAITCQVKDLGSIPAYGCVPIFPTDIAA